MSAPARLRCAIYTRKSTEEGLEQGFNSLHAQREACEAYVLSQAGEGWIGLPTIYDDGGFSGGSMERPALKQLLVDIERQAIDIVVVYKVDRLTRSLSDFARIVEVFDKRGVSFVSVTQAFNTTTSMGRLTLNVLLSFAQFEREVTGERIRDKIAASKAKGMWMGGNPPLGYDIPTDLQSRALVANAAEAETIRLIFQRYLDLGSVRALAADLRKRGVTTKLRTAANGRVTGGGPWLEGPLYYLLKNRVYRGDIEHKGAVHTGRHEAIVPAAEFEEVQRRLGAKDTRRRGATTAVSASLTGKIFDDRGHPMSPVTARRGARTYSYYVSQAVIRHDRGEPGSIARAPVWTIDGLVERELKAWLQNSEYARADGEVVRVVLAASAVEIQLKGREEAGAVETTVSVPALLKVWGGTKRLVAPDAPATQGLAADEALLRAIARGKRWDAQLASGERNGADEIASVEGVASRYVDRVLQLAWLAPDLIDEFMSGARLRDRDLTSLLRLPVPMKWAAQRANLSISVGS